MSIIIGPVRPDLIREETLADMYRASASLRPHKTALIFDDRSVTYAELDRWTDAIAAFLQSRGIGRGFSVGLWWPRSLELHAAILGIVKSGAAYVPLDREMPLERVQTVMQEVGAAACFTDSDDDMCCATLRVPPMPDADTFVTVSSGPLPADRAYVLYTSGSTGRPKGIPIAHRQIAHLVRSENSLLGIREDDKVYQGFSVSFDMWCEEVWIGLHAGATIWIADATTAKVVDELSEVLREQRITVLHAVPSLLAVMDEDIPSLRLVNAGGEACTPQVLNKWAHGDRKFFNGYGPTETTVSASYAELRAGDKITIGKPLPNYNMAVVDEHYELIPFGQKGQLVITGPGVSEGYVNRPDLTVDKFRRKTASLAALPGDIMYLSGDSVVMQPDGEIEFHGRIDDQIKLRGYRIELGEIENQLHAQTGVSAAAVAVRKDSNDQDELVGYVLMEGELAFDEQAFRSELAKVLPPYMVPAVILELSEMPRLPSGKVDRKKLPRPVIFEEAPRSYHSETIDDSAPLADKVTAILRGIFPGRDISTGDDFFTDLGGHSLLAAAFVSRMRSTGGLPQASIRDVYQHRPIGNLTSHWKNIQGTPGKASKKRVFHTVPTSRYMLCWAAQSVALLGIYTLFALQIFVPYLGYYYIQQATDSYGYAILGALAFFCLMPPLFSLISVLIKWVVIGRFRAGDYPLWGTYYFRWWLVNTVQGLAQMEFLNGTPLYPMYLRWMGVKVAPDAQIAAAKIGAEDLLTIGRDVSISSQVLFNNAWVEGGLLKIREIKIGDHAYIGSSAVIAGDTVIEEWGELGDLSALPQGQRIRRGEVWHGSPAQRVATRDIKDLPQPLEVSPHKLFVYKIVFTALLLVFPFAMLVPLLPALLGLNYLDNTTVGDYDFHYLVWTPFLALSYVVIFILQTVVLTRLLQRGIGPGIYPVHSRTYIRKWLSEQLMALSLIVVHPIYATVYITSMFRALGAKVGKNTEISTANNVTHPLFEIGEESFIADAVTLGEADIRGQRLILDHTVIGSNSFIGNSALIPQGYHMPDDMLVGVLSTPPSPQQIDDRPGSDWFGSPAIALPHRQQSYPYPRTLTHTPSPLRRLARAFIELIRIIIPQTAVICLSVVFIGYCHGLIVDRPIWMLITFFPIYYLTIIGLPAFLITVAMKWLLVGKYNVAQHPMWTRPVWFSEAVTATYESLSKTFLLEYLKGTPWLPVALRMMGVKIGKRAWLNTLDITEYDMVTIGDDTALNSDCGPQTHLFEDRVMKIGKVKMGDRCSIGARSIVLYDSELGDGTSYAALSLVMKGEVLAPGTDWEGSPVRPKQ
ncbi:MAG: amino acid adenylation domain-containing protein [Bacteroidetes bacterium]|nr:amino acid adenylation domain-containing protein [Bacteroidota bacterium]